ncbi:MAG: amidase [Gaiella sp.]
MIRLALSQLASGRLTAASLLERFLAEVDADEERIKAWVAFDAERARALARDLDAIPAGHRGPLHGIPIGVKDIFDTHDLPTEYGSPIYAGHRPAADSAVVALARRAGMLLLGKLVTTEFAAWPPGPTTNPHDPARTPGGSSSGSAAAVAAGMVPVAFASQTTGSIIRPAAFCGVVGYKPTHGTLPCVGVKAISESFDTVGVMAACVDDAALVVETLARRTLSSAPARAPRIGVCFTHEWPAALPETVALFESLPGELRAAGAEVREVELPASFASLVDAQNTVWSFEIARCLVDEHARFADRIREPLQTMIADGGRIPVAAYDEARLRITGCGTELPAVLADVDVLLTPAAPGEAPPVATTGDPIFNRAWSALGVPVVNLPAGRGPTGLPLGVQLVGLRGQDAELLSAAGWVEAALLRAGPARSAHE